MRLAQVPRLKERIKKSTLRQHDTYVLSVLNRRASVPYFLGKHLLACIKYVNMCGPRHSGENASCVFSTGNFQQVACLVFAFVNNTFGRSGKWLVLLGYCN